MDVEVRDNEGRTDRDRGDRDDERGVVIIVNGQRKTVTARATSFEEVVSLAYDGNPPSGPNWEFTVTYRRGPDENPTGSLVAGQKVRIKTGMIFDVTATDKS